MELIVTSGALATLAAEAARAAPEECCGLLLGAGQIEAIVPARNVAATPRTHFEIDPAALIAAHRAAREGTGLPVLGYYHSHPAGRAAPSATDRAQASGDGLVWAIIGADETSFWRDTANGFAPLCTGAADG